MESIAQLASLLEAFLKACHDIFSAHCHRSEATERYAIRHKGRRLSASKRQALIDAEARAVKARLVAAAKDLASETVAVAIANQDALGKFGIDVPALLNSIVDVQDEDLADNFQELNSARKRITKFLSLIRLVSKNEQTKSLNHPIVDRLTNRKSKSKKYQISAKRIGLVTVEAQRLATRMPQFKISDLYKEVKRKLPDISRRPIEDWMALAEAEGIIASNRDGAKGIKSTRYGSGYTYHFVDGKNAVKNILKNDEMDRDFALAIGRNLISDTQLDDLAKDIDGEDLASLPEAATFYIQDGTNLEEAIKKCRRIQVPIWIVVAKSGERVILKGNANTLKERLKKLLSSSNSDS